MTQPRTTRRELLAVGGSAALLSLAGATSFASEKPNSIEAANEKLVKDFCAAWSTMDMDRVSDYLAENLVYQIIEGMPLVKGRESFKKRVQPFLAGVERIEWEIRRSHVIGNLVINDRVDHFYRSGDQPDMHFHVAGLFVITDGKIEIWRDYRMPQEKKKDNAEADS